MLWFYRRGPDTLSCEVRLAADGPGYELVITEKGVSRVERFTSVVALLSREHELLAAWRAQGWTHDVGRPLAR